MNPGQTQQNNSQTNDSLPKDTWRTQDQYARGDTDVDNFGRVNRQPNQLDGIGGSAITAFGAYQKRPAAEAQPTSELTSKAFKGEMDEPTDREWSEKVRLRDELRSEDSNNAANQGPSRPPLEPNSGGQSSGSNGPLVSQSQLARLKLGSNPSETVRATMKEAEINLANAYRMARDDAATTYERLRGEGGKQAA